MHNYGFCSILTIAGSNVKNKLYHGLPYQLAQSFLTGLKTITYRLLVNLSLSDILIALLSGAGHVTHTWIIGNKCS